MMGKKLLYREIFSIEGSWANTKENSMIAVQDLTKTYGTYEAVRGISFEIEPGEIVGFLGPNGAGKTTSMRILTGYHPATQGSARIAGFDVHTQPLEVKKRVGYLPESVPLYVEMVVSSYLQYVAEIKGITRSKRKSAVADVMDRCGLGHMQSRVIHNLSKGYRQRVGLAQALLGNPPVLILDEPTVGLDPKQIVGIRQMIKDLAQEHTVLLSTHILPEVSMICDRVLILHQGQIVSEKRMADLSSTRRVAFHLGGSIGSIRGILDDTPEIDAVSVAGEEYTVAYRDDAPPQEVNPGVIRRLVSAGVDVRRVEHQSQTLEEVFIDAISGEAEVTHA